jgi:uncharacterized protein (DUF697 family)
VSNPNRVTDPAAVAQSIIDASEKHRKSLKRPVVLVTGYTGSGKTSLIRAICGPEIVSEEKIGDARPQTMGFEPFENDLIRFWDSKGFELGQLEEEFEKIAHDYVRSRQDDKNVDNHIHLAWYTLQGPSARVTDCDKRLIKNLFKNTLVVITKKDITKTRQLDGMTSVLKDAGVPPAWILPCSEEDKPSLAKLVTLSHELLPFAYREAFLAAQHVSLEAKRMYSRTIILTASAAAATAAGLNPLPLSDAVLITPIQIGMLVSLATLYGETRESVKMAYAPVIARVAGMLAAASLAKLIPAIGSIANASVAGGLTAAMGHLVEKQLFHRAEARINGFSVPDFSPDPSELKRLYEENKMKKSTID